MADKPQYWDTDNEEHGREFRRRINRAWNGKDVEACPSLAEHWRDLSSSRAWWNELPKAERDHIDQIAEQFADVDDFFRKCLGVEVPNEYPEQVYDGLSRAVKYLQHELGQLVADREAMFEDRPAARKRVEGLARSAKTLLVEALGLTRPARRPVENTGRDSHWSRLARQGKTYDDIAEQHLRETGDAVDGLDVGQTVRRHRKRRESLTWFLRWQILQNKDSLK